MISLQCFADELTHLLQNLEASEQVISQIWSALVEANNKEKDLTTLIMEYTREARTRDNLLRSLINVYESEIARLKSDISKDHLSSHQKATIRQEMKVLETLCYLNTRDGSEAFDSVTPASGKKKVKDNFSRKLFSLFGVLSLDENEGRDSE